MSSTSPAAPTVSVVLSTYNRSYTLRYAIESVRDSSFSDWELIVVGDACTDDTAKCVASFSDPRITFINLPARCGDQSGPNNYGVGLSRGRYVAFLNHDDFYLPNHLAMCIATLEASDADLLWVPCVAVLPNQKSSYGSQPFRYRIVGVPETSKYSPMRFYPASSWVFRRNSASRVGPWKSSTKTWVFPSQEWLFRAWRSGLSLRFLPRVGVIVVPAGHWPGCYSRGESPEHAWLARWFKEDPRYLEHILEKVALDEATEHLADLRPHPLLTIRRVLLWPLHAIQLHLGIHPRSLGAAITFGRRGGVTRRHRQFAGVE